MDRGVLSLVPIISSPPTAAVQQGSQVSAGEEGAFQFLLESLLFETLAGQVFQGGKGLLAGIDLGPDTGDTSGEEEQKGQELLALLELLQVPLMEHLHSVLPGDGGLLRENLSVSRPVVQEPVKSLDNMAANAAASGEPGAPQAEPGLLATAATLTGTEVQLPSQLDGNAQAGVRNQSSNNQPGQPGVLTATLPDDMASFQELGRGEGLSAEPKGQPVLSSMVWEMNASKETAPSTKTAGTEQHLVNFTGNQILENQETALSSNRAEGSAANRSGITWLELTEQMIQSGKLKLLATKQEIELQLKPEYLGKLAIRLTLENGAMTAKFIVESHQVGRMLEQNLPQLRQTLAEQGIRFDQAQVEVGDPGSFAQERQPQWQQGRAFRESLVFHAEEPVEHQMREEDYLEPVRRAGIDYRA